MEPNTTVRLSGSQPSSNTDPDRMRYLNLRVEDAPSGQPILDIEIPADVLLRLLGSSGGERLPAWVVPAKYAGRIGRELEVKSVAVPSEVTHTLPYEGAERRTAAQAWADSYAAEKGWEEASARNTNQGWKATLRRWSSG
jgi:hypothetical protein